MWIGALGLMSWKAKNSSFSNTLLHGISPFTIFSKTFILDPFMRLKFSCDYSQKIQTRKFT